MAHASMEPIIASVDLAGQRLVYGLSRTPDDRLDWSVGGSATTPIQILGRAAHMAEDIAYFLEKGTWNMDAENQKPLQNREEVEAGVRSAIEKLKKALAGLTEEDLAGDAPAPWGGSISMRLWPTLALQGMGYAQGQLNLIQLAYGDEDPNIPPDWMQHPA